MANSYAMMEMAELEDRLEQAKGSSWRYEREEADYIEGKLAVLREDCAKYIMTDAQKATSNGLRADYWMALRVKKHSFGAERKKADAKLSRLSSRYYQAEEKAAAEGKTFPKVTRNYDWQALKITLTNE